MTAAVVQRVTKERRGIPVLLFIRSVAQDRYGLFTVQNDAQSPATVIELVELSMSFCHSPSVTSSCAAVLQSEESKNCAIFQWRSQWILRVEFAHFYLRLFSASRGRYRELA